MLGFEFEDTYSTVPDGPYTLTLSVCPTATVGADWLKVTLVIPELVPMVTLMIPHEAISVVQTVTDDEPVVPVVVRLIDAPFTTA